MTASKVHCQRHVYDMCYRSKMQQNVGGWMSMPYAIDKYSACHNNNNRPQAFAIGQNVTRAGAGQYKLPGPSQKFVSNAAPKSNNGGRFTPVNATGTRKCFHCGSFDHLRDRCPRLSRPTADVAGRPARVSRVNAMDDNRNATIQPTATCGACGRHATNNFHTSVVRGARGRTVGAWRRAEFFTPRQPRHATIQT